MPTEILMNNRASSAQSACFSSGKLAAVQRFRVQRFRPFEFRMRKAEGGKKRKKFKE
jgi:hypothetical protein